MRGEDQRTMLAHAGPPGSPPHARGRPTDHARSCRATGITPACAGKTTNLLREADNFNGSPPHARGRRELAVQGIEVQRITPACAGKTSPARPAAAARRGSPPHARGRPSAGGYRDLPRRITPACAGKTATSAFVSSCEADHPRMRGEDVVVDLQEVGGPGSPPHARGRRVMQVSLVCFWGITPACAGKTFPDSSPTPSSPGSPPHARGRHRADKNAGLFVRITPACAGKTQRPRP